jgi:hypothetical protein
LRDAVHSSGKNIPKPKPVCVMSVCVGGGGGVIYGRFVAVLGIRDVFPGSDFFPSRIRIKDLSKALVCVCVCVWGGGGVE